MANATGQNGPLDNCAGGDGPKKQGTREAFFVYTCMYVELSAFYMLTCFNNCSCILKS